MNLAVIILWYLSVLASFFAGYFAFDKLPQKRSGKPQEKSEQQQFEALKIKRELDNFWSYDGSQQD